MNLTEFEDIVNLSERLLMQTKNNIMTVDEFGYWTEGVLLVEELIIRLFPTQPKTLEYRTGRKPLFWPLCMPELAWNTRRSILGSVLTK